jgi:UrcA family protein
MNAQRGLRLPPRNAVIATACIALGAIAPITTFADPPAGQTPHALESRVSLSDLDLSTPEGARAAQRRLRKKAESLCRQLWDGATASYRWSYTSCVRKTLASAIQRLDVAPLVTADRPPPAP